MKYKIVLSNKFKRDLKLASKRGKNLSKLVAVVEALAADTPLSINYHDHNLSGQLSGFRECHIEPDWLLIYKKEENNLILLLMRTDSHSELF